MSDVISSPTITLSFAGSQTLRCIEQSHARLVDALNRSGGSLRIDCGGVTEADLCFVQILMAARRSAAQRGMQLEVALPAGSALAAVMQACGVPENTVIADPN